MMLFWIGLIALVGWLVARTVAGQGFSSPPERSGLERAREVLAERYARGAISTEEYRDKLDHLSRTE
ncbi:SHOCT domain-containing protein [Nonomuraea sp. CA-143628]|uniref:SHOCT domain-containing protein n=1 Tax=Nonomuraea sp. CA-143628 TaxID=3239997 RepID=UPI003D911F66